MKSLSVIDESNSLTHNSYDKSSSLDMSDISNDILHHLQIITNNNNNINISTDDVSKEDSKTATSGNEDNMCQQSTSVLDILARSLLDSSVLKNNDLADTCSTMDIVTTDISDNSVDNSKNETMFSDNISSKLSATNNVLHMMVKGSPEKSSSNIDAYNGQPFNGKITDFSLIIGKPVVENNVLYNKNEDNLATTKALEDDELMMTSNTNKSNNNPSAMYNLAQIQLLKLKEARDHESKLVLLQQHCMKILKNISMAFPVWAVYKNSYMWHSDIILNSTSIKQLSLYGLIFDDIENDCISQYQELQQLLNHYPEKRNSDSNTSDCLSNPPNIHIVSIFTHLFSQSFHLSSCLVRTLTQLETNLFASIFAQVNPYTITQSLLHLDHLRQQQDPHFKGLEDFQPFTATYITTQAIHAAQQPPIQFMKGLLTRFKSSAELTNIRNVKRKTNPAFMYLVPTNPKQCRNSSNCKYYKSNTPASFEAGLPTQFDQFTELNNTATISTATNNTTVQLEDDNSIEDHTRLITQILLSKDGLDDPKKDFYALEQSNTATFRNDISKKSSEYNIQSKSDYENGSKINYDRLSEPSKMKYIVSSNTPEMLIPAVLCSPQFQSESKDFPNKVELSDNLSEKSSKTILNSKSSKNTSNRKSANSKVYDLPENVEAFRSQVKGVYYDDTSNRWCASWHERRTGKKRSRYFAVKKFGFNNAKSHAMDARLEAEESGECAPTNRG